MSAGIQMQVIRMMVSMGGESHTVSHEVPKHGVAKKQKAQIVRELGDRVADFFEAPSRAPRKVDA